MDIRLFQSRVSIPVNELTNISPEMWFETHFSDDDDNDLESLCICRFDKWGFDDNEVWHHAFTVLDGFKNSCEPITWFGHKYMMCVFYFIADIEGCKLKDSYIHLAEAD